MSSNGSQFSSSESIIDSLRKPKIFDFVIFDWLATAATAIVLQKIISADFYIIFVILIILSILLHVLFKVDTTTNYLLGLSDKPKRSI